jgi:hypothetical protein
MKKVLFVIQELENKTLCGIGIISDLIAKTICKSQKHRIEVLYADNFQKVLDYAQNFDPDVIIYNYSTTTMPWVTSGRWRLGLRAKQILRFPDGSQKTVDDFSPDNWGGFEYLLMDDDVVNTKSSKNVFTTQRLMAPYVPRTTYIDQDVPIIGFQGQLVPHKGLHNVVKQVQHEFDEAIIRVHSPHYHYGPGAQVWNYALNLAKKAIYKPGVRLEHSTDIKSNQEIVDFLAENTINCYFYDYLDGYGLASATDYALAAKRPFAVTRSHQFRNYWDSDPSILIENNSLKQIISNGLKPLEKYYEKYSEESVIADYERIIDTVCKKGTSFSF